MKQNNFKLVWVFLLFVGVFSLHAQQKSVFKSVPDGPLQLTEDNQRHLAETGFVRCATVEMEELRRQNNPNIQSKEEFENWLAPLVEARKQLIAQEIADGTYRRAQVTIPIIFHVLTGSFGDANDVSASKIQAQIDQLNLDFNNLAGSIHPAAASAEITFIPALVDPSGNLLAEPGIHRVYGYSGNISTTALDNTIKPATVWDRNRYVNIWTAQLGSQLLGYAQFPSNSSLPGMPGNGGSALTDGVVIHSGTVGSMANPGSMAPYNRGRTLTHELGHWIGLRHIWGDTSGCGNDDFCADTPDSTASNGGCPNIDRCPNDGLGRDMVENYMDYTNDACMNIFTNDQVNRMLTVLTNSPGRSSLPNSTAGDPPTPIISFGIPNMSQPEGTGCHFQFVHIPIKIAKAPSQAAIITFSVSGTATPMVDYEILTQSLYFAAGSTADQTLDFRVWADGFIEPDETIIIDMTLTTMGDAVLATNGTETFTYTILNDDFPLTEDSLTTVFYDGFETYDDFQITPVGGWTMLDVDGKTTYAITNTTFPNQNYAGTFIVFNPSQTSPSLAGGNWDAHTGSKGYYSFAANPAPNNDYIFTPQISLNGTGSQIKFWAKSATAQYGLERFKVGVSTTDTNPSSFTMVSNGLYEQAPDTWTEFTYNLSAYDGQDIYISFNVISNDAFAFMLDDVSVTTNTQTNVQTAENSAFGKEMRFSTTGDAYVFDHYTKNIMTRLQNMDGFDYGCARVFINRAGQGSRLLENPDPAEFVMAKSFTITTDTSNTTGDIKAAFYFTEAELIGWENATGRNRSELYIFREVNGTMVDIAAATIGSFNTDVTLEANLTGLNGDFYFGPLNAYLSVENHMLNNFSMYPNPVTNQLTIKTANNILPDNYIVYNMLGQVVLSKKVTNESDLLINTSALSNGMYFIKLTQESNQVSLPFIKR